MDQPFVSESGNNAYALAYQIPNVTDHRPASERGQSELDGESYRLAAPGPFGDSWTRVTFGADGVTLSTDGEETVVRYVDLRGINDIDVRNEHGAARITFDLVVLGAHIVLTGGSAIARRLGGYDVSPPAGLTRYANEVVASAPLVRLTLTTDDGAYYLYAEEETAEALAAAFRGRKESEERR